VARYVVGFLGVRRELLRASKDGRKHRAEHHPSRRARKSAHLRMTAVLISARRANHLRAPNPVQPLCEKYSALFLTQISCVFGAVLPDKRGVAHVTKRAVGCGGRGVCERRTQALADGEVVWS
jgi:hypothetical protein